MKIKTLILMFLISFPCFSYKESKISTIDFVQVQHENHEEALFYYQNNWKKLREKAVQKDYIDSFLLLETPATLESPFHLILITTYSDHNQYSKREGNFAELIKHSGGLKLLNAKKPDEFRKTLFSQEMVKSFN